MAPILPPRSNPLLRTPNPLVAFSHGQIGVRIWKGWSEVRVGPVLREYSVWPQSVQVVESRSSRKASSLKETAILCSNMGFPTSSFTSSTRLWAFDGLERFRLSYAIQQDAGRYISSYNGFTTACTIAPTMKKFGPHPPSSYVRIR